MQNAEPLLLDDGYLGLIDGVTKESLLTGLDGPESWNSPDDVNWSLKKLQRAQSMGIPVFAIEYATKADLLARAARSLRQSGFKAFFGNRALDRLPQEHPALKAR